MTVPGMKPPGTVAVKKSVGQNFKVLRHNRGTFY